MVFVTGDTHGDWMNRLNMDSFPEQREMSKDDYVIVCGDFGIWNNSKMENYNLDWLEEKSFTTLFVDGNHSNFDILDNLPIKEWHNGKVHKIREHVIHLMRGEVFTIKNHSFFAFGGASSHDISEGILDIDDPEWKRKARNLDNQGKYMYRVKGLSWWDRELPSKREMQNGIDNLGRYKNKVDYIITHCPYTSLLRRLDGGSNIYKNDILTDYLQNIKQNVDYKHWLFGHMHINRSYYWERSTCLYEQIIRIL